MLPGPRMFRVPSRTTAYRRVFMGDFADVQTVPFDEDNYRGQGTISKMDAIG